MSHRRENDAPRADRAYKKWKDGLSDGLVHLDSYRDTIQEERATLTELRVKCDPDDEQGILVIIKGYIGGSWYVAFHRADSISAALSEVGNRLRNGSLKWREDQYRENNG